MKLNVENVLLEVATCGSQRPSPGIQPSEVFRHVWKTFEYCNLYVNFKNVKRICYSSSVSPRIYRLKLKSSDNFLHSCCQFLLSFVVNKMDYWKQMFEKLSSFKDFVKFLRKIIIRFIFTFYEVYSNTNFVKEPWYL